MFTTCASDAPQPVSPLTFEEVNRIAQSGLTDSELETYSRRVRGTRVRWTGKLVEIDANNRVRLEIGDYPSSIEFKVSSEVAQSISANRLLTFTGTLEKVSLAQTFPPIPKTTVFLEDVMLEKSLP
jgi:hypothetical protein